MSEEKVFHLFKNHDDAVLEMVKSELAWEPTVDANAIEASCEGGVITLRGRVGYLFEKIGAVEAAQRVAGVRAVSDHIVVDTSLSRNPTDRDVVHAVFRAVDWEQEGLLSSEINSQQISQQTTDGRNYGNEFRHDQR